MKNKIFGILILFIVCFIGVGNVKAVTGTCFYSGDNFKIVSQTGNYDNYTIAVAISYDCSADGKCNSSYAAGYTDKNSVSQTINFSNASSFFGKSSTEYKSKFLKDNKISCPSNVVVSGDATADKIYFYYDCVNGEAANGQCIGLGKKISKQSVPEGDTLADKVKSVTDLGHYNTNRGSSTPATNPNENSNNEHSNADYIPGIRDGDTEPDNPYPLNETNCVSLLGTGEGSLGQILKDVFFGMCIVGVVILIFTTSGDFIKAITSSDNDAMSKAFKSSKNRIIVALILLILPVLVSFVIDVINSNSYVVTDSDGNNIEIKIGNPSECSITS